VRLVEVATRTVPSGAPALRSRFHALTSRLILLHTLSFVQINVIFDWTTADESRRMTEPPNSNPEPRRNQTKRPWRRDCLVVSLAVGVIGVTFGVFAEAAGFDWPRILVMSALVFTGASQFAAVGVIDDGGSGGAAVGAALLLATRNALYGPVIRRFLPQALRPRLAAAHLVIDETVAMAVSQRESRAARDAFWFTGLTLWLCWNLGTLAGAALGGVLATPETWGLDAAFPAIFVALLATQLRTTAGRVAAICAVAIALGAVPFTASGLPILLAVIALVPGYLVGRRKPHGNASAGSSVSSGE